MNAKKLPADPMIRQLIRSAQNAQINRRAVLGGATATAATLALAACTPNSTEDKPKMAADKSDSDKKITWANWAAYIDEDEDGKTHPTLDAFTKKTGIKVKYDVAVDDNNSYNGKVHDQLALGQDIGADAVVLTDWMVARWIRLGYTQKLDHVNIPNIKNLNPQLLNVDFDKGRTHSLPWQGGFGGICWNKEKLPNGLKGVKDLWDPSLKGRVGVLSEMRDTLGLIMQQQGVNIDSKWGDTEFANAIDFLKKQVSDGQVRNVKGNSYLEDLKSEDTLAAICWSGDITTLNAEAGDKWVFALPEEGATLWNDNFVIPIGSPHKKNVETLIDYYYQPEVAAEVAAWVNYITPVSGAKEAAIAIDPALAENQLIFPNEETLKKAHVFRGLNGTEEQKYQADFQSIVLGA